MSISGARFSAIGTMGEFSFSSPPLAQVWSQSAVTSHSVPDGSAHLTVFGVPPSWMSTTIALTPLRLSTGTSALAVSTSSRNSSPAMPLAVTMSGVASSVIPMKPIFAPWTFLIA